MHPRLIFAFASCFFASSTLRDNKKLKCRERSSDLWECSLQQQSEIIGRNRKTGATIFNLNILHQILIADASHNFCIAKRSMAFNVILSRISQTGWQFDALSRCLCCSFNLKRSKVSQNNDNLNLYFKRTNFAILIRIVEWETHLLRHWIRRLDTFWYATSKRDGR